jgi:hypothetical protein
MQDHLPTNILYSLLLLLGVNLMAACVLLAREAFSRPTRLRTALILVSGLAFVVVLLQVATGYYFIFDVGGSVALIGCAAAYFVLMVLTLSGKRIAWRLNRIVGVFGLGAPVLIAALFRVSLFLGILFVFGLSDNHLIFRGRISSSLSYGVAITHPLMGAGDYYHYKLFRNSRWFPIVRKEISSGPITFCSVPAVQVSAGADTKDGFVRIACHQTTDEFVTGRIPIGESVAAIADAPVK